MTSVHRKADRRSPLVLDVLELGHGAGSMREVSSTVPAPADLGLEVIAVPEGSDIELDLRLEAVGEGILVTGTADVLLHGSCARCLTEIDGSETFDLQELFFHPGHEVSEDERQIVEDTIDLDGVLRDAVVLELPFTPLCKEDCLGLCPECGANLNDDPTHAHEAVVDARWAALAELDVESNN